MRSVDIAVIGAGPAGAATAIQAAIWAALADAGGDASIAAMTSNNAFVDAALLERWQLDVALVPLANPLSAELGVMRPRLLPGLVDALARNAARQQGRVRLFELGKVFAASDVGGQGPRETPRIAAVASGDVFAEQ